MDTEEVLAIMVTKGTWYPWALQRCGFNYTVTLVQEALLFSTGELEDSGRHFPARLPLRVLKSGQKLFPDLQIFQRGA